MRCLATLLILALPAALPTVASAQQGPLQKALLERFDKNGDGKLDESERKAAREASEARRQTNQRANFQQLVKRFDADGDGKLNPEENKKLQAYIDQRFFQAFGGKEATMKRFDADKNGRLDPQERGVIREAIQARQRRAGFSGNPPPKRENRFDQTNLLKKYDANNNGRLEPVERRRAIADARAKSAG